MPSPIVEGLIILLLVLLNGFFALAEIAVVSSRKARLQHAAAEGDRKAEAVLQLTEEPTAFLSSVQVGVTLISIIAGAYGSATLAARLDVVLRHIPWLALYAKSISVFLVIVSIGYFTLILGELVPKRIALTNPERYAGLVARPMRIIATIASPVVSFLSASANLVIRILPFRAAPEPPVSDEEIKALFEEGISAGVFDPAEKDIIDRLFRLSDRRVNAIMTLRMDIAWLEINDPVDVISRTIAQHDFTAYPVCEETIDHVVGVILARDLIRRVLTGEPIRLPEMIRTPLILHEGFHALKAIEALKQSGTHIAIIIDEYGDTQGLVTLTDLLESLVGEIPSIEEPLIVRRQDGSLLVDGLIPIDELKAELGITVSLPSEEENRYQTLAGFFMTLTGRVPQEGDTVTWATWRFEVIDMDANRIDRVLIERILPPVE